MANSENRRMFRVRRRMFKKQKGLCHLCGKPMAISQEKVMHDSFATFDHLIPRSQGGVNAQDNLPLAHRRCNEKRANRPLPASAASGGAVKS